MRLLVSIVVLLCLVVTSPATASSRHYEVVITDAYVEMHTGPGSGYPIFHVVERGEQVEVLKRRTDWYKIRDARDVEGWVDARSLSRTVEPDGTPTKIENLSVLDIT